MGPRTEIGKARTLLSGEAVAEHKEGVAPTAPMICPASRGGETHPGTSMVALERGGLTFVVKGVLRMADEAAAAGSLVDIRTYQAA